MHTDSLEKMSDCKLAGFAKRNEFTGQSSTNCLVYWLTKNTSKRLRTKCKENLYNTLGSFIRKTQLLRLYTTSMNACAVHIVSAWILF